MVGKEHFTYLYSPARDRALTKRNIRAGWSATGLFLFNPEQVLRDVLKPPADVINIEAASTDLLDEVPHIYITPVTPVTSEALTSLHNLIIRDTNVLKGTSKNSLQKRR